MPSVAPAVHLPFATQSNTDAGAVSGLPTVAGGHFGDFVAAFMASIATGTAAQASAPASATSETGSVGAVANTVATPASTGFGTSVAAVATKLAEGALQAAGREASPGSEAAGGSPTGPNATERKKKTGTATDTAAALSALLQGQAQVAAINPNPSAIVIQPPIVSAAADSSVHGAKETVSAPAGTAAFKAIAAMAGDVKSSPAQQPVDALAFGDDGVAAPISAPLDPVAAAGHAIADLLAKALGDSANGSQATASTTTGTATTSTATPVPATATTATSVPKTVPVTGIPVAASTAGPSLQRPVSSAPGGQTSGGGTTAPSVASAPSGIGQHPAVPLDQSALLSSRAQVAKDSSTGRAATPAPALTQTAATAATATSTKSEAAAAAQASIVSAPSDTPAQPGATAAPAPQSKTMITAATNTAVAAATPEVKPPSQAATEVADASLRQAAVSPPITRMAQIRSRLQAAHVGAASGVKSAASSPVAKAPALRVPGVGQAATETPKTLGATLDAETAAALAADKAAGVKTLATGQTKDSSAAIAKADTDASPPAPTNTGPLVQPLTSVLAKAADPAPAVATSMAIPLAAVASTLVAHARAGSSEFTMRLDPADLGKIDVTMKVSSDGQVRAHMIVERPETLDLLVRDQRGLQQTLDQAGFKADPSSLQFSLGQQQQGQGQQQGWQGQQSHPTARPVPVPELTQTQIEQAAYVRPQYVRADGIDMSV